VTQHWRQNLERLVRNRFRGRFDLSGIGGISPREVFRSRGLAALTLQLRTGVEDDDVLAMHVVDDLDDNGLDAVHVDESSPKLTLVQAKWPNKPTKTIEKSELQRFADGLTDLLNRRWDRFNDKVKALVPRIDAAIAQPGLPIDMTLVTAGDPRLTGPARRVVDDLLRRHNEFHEVVTFRVISAEAVYDHAVALSADTPIDLTVELDGVGWAAAPFVACYGTVDAHQIAAWYDQHGARLFGRNIRQALGPTPANQELVATLENESERFWYYNNGIVVLCEQIRSAPVGAGERRIGRFSLVDASIVNGAQTVASIAEAATRLPEAVERARVLFRAVSLDGTPERFAEDVTRATNTQNRIERRDFLAQDPTQRRLAREMTVTCGKVYEIKRSSFGPTRDEGCDLVEATIALAVSHHDISHAVLAYSRPTQFWEDAQRHVQELFSADLGAVSLWRLVCAQRHVTDVVASLLADHRGRSRAIIADGRWLVSHLSLSQLSRREIDDPLSSWDEYEFDQLDLVVPRIVALLIREVETHFPEDPVNVLFGSVTKGRLLVERVRERLTASVTEDGPTPGTNSGLERDQIEFHLDGRYWSARGHLRGPGFVVRAGSQAARRPTTSVRALPGAAAKREWLIGQGVLRLLSDNPDRLVLDRDEYFESPTQAAAVVKGRQSNGRTDWRSVDGRSMNATLLDAEP
jgi:hypothetical protein